LGAGSAVDAESHMNNTVKTALLLGTMSALLLLIGEALGGAGGMAVGFLFAVATNFASYWFSDKIVLRMYDAQEVGPGHRLFDHRRSAREARRPAPNHPCYVIPDVSPNAFATGRDPQHAAVARPKAFASAHRRRARGRTGP
jgi:Zn-dependent protease with chaperone function